VNVSIKKSEINWSENARKKKQRIIKYDGKKR
jgi:hypothetical protein